MTEESARLLQEGIAAARAGDKAKAKRLLMEVTERDERNEQAWLWLSGVMEDLEEVRICLENVLALNPGNERARQGLAWIQKKQAVQAAPPAYAPPASSHTPPAPSYTPPAPSYTPPSRPAPPPIEEQIASPYPVEEEAEPAKGTRPEANRVPCPACGALNFDFANECVKCGFPFAVTCNGCGEFVPTDTGLCPRCGAELPLPTKLSGVRDREAKVDDEYRQGLGYMEEKRYQEAKASFEEALVRDPDHIEARFSLGLACAKLGLAEDARQHWEEVRQLQPSYPDIDKSLASLLSPKERRRLAQEKKKAAPKPKKKDEALAGRSLMYGVEKEKEEAKPTPEEEMSGLEIFLYVLLVGLVFGVAYALNRPSATSDLGQERILLILKQSGVITAGVLVFWVVLGILARLASLIFRAGGKMGGYMAAATRFLMPGFLLILPIVLGIPQIVVKLPANIQQWLQTNPSLPFSLSIVWLIFIFFVLFFGLFSLVRSVGRVGRIALWKGFIAGMLALILALVVVGAAGYFGADYARPYLDQFGFGPQTVTPAPGTTPGVTPAATPTVSPVTTPVTIPTPLATPVPTTGG